MNEVVTDNPFGLHMLWDGGNLLTRGTLCVLVIMSFLTWWVVLTKFLDQRLLRKSLRMVEKQVWAASTLEDGVRRLRAKDPLRKVAEDGLRASSHYEGRVSGRMELKEWMEASLQRSVNRVARDLKGGLSLLASIGSTAPFVGLFGTVIGVLNALVTIGVSTQPSLDKVAGPVGEALYQTAIGLFVAVPAVLGYNWLLRRNVQIQEGIHEFAGDLHTYFISGQRLEMSPG